MRTKNRPLYRKAIFYDYTSHDGVVHNYTPRHILESLEYAQQELNYSNYDCDKLERAAEIVRRYCEERAIPLGLSRKQREQIEKRNHAARGRAFCKVKTLAQAIKFLKKWT